MELHLQRFSFSLRIRPTIRPRRVEPCQEHLNPGHRIEVIMPFEVITTQRPFWRRIASIRPRPGSTSPDSTSTMLPTRLCNMATPRYTSRTAHPGTVVDDA